jgi:hypothetical protein
MFKKIILSSALLLSMPVWAEDAEFDFGDVNQVNHKLSIPDIAFIAPGSPIAKAWLKLTNLTPPAYTMDDGRQTTLDYNAILYYVNCDTKQLAIKQVVSYLSNGANELTTPPTLDYIDIPIRSIGHLESLAICNVARKHAKDEKVGDPAHKPDIKEQLKQALKH